MDQNTKNPFDNINVDIRRAADGKTNDHGETPWPLAPWADSSYFPFTPTSHAPDPNPHGDVRARVEGFLDREAAREAVPSSSDRPARCPATLQRRRVRATRRSERAAPRRAVASGFDAPAGETSSPVEGVTAEAPVPQPFEFREAPAQTVGPRMQSATEGMAQSGAGAAAEENRPDYLDGMVDWMNGFRRERNSHSGGRNDPRARAAAAFGRVVPAPAPCPPPVANTASLYANKRMMQASMEDVYAILGTGPCVPSDREQRPTQTSMESVNAELSPRRRVRGDREQLRKKAAARRELLQRLRDRDHRP
ncbi:hypothetical protein MMC27_005733 [Xylographa pallens]|nr:hypothetical protein [Xylographa pallens]